MNILAWLVLGLAAGWMASIIMKTNSQQGVLMDIVLGVVGAFVGGFIVSLFGAQGVNGLNIYSLVVATFGAVVSIWAGRRLGLR